MISLSFHGAARTVTGSKHLLEVDDRRLLVDCGLFQGRKDLRLLNWQELPFDPATLDVVVLTHAHIDHSGLLPKLVAAGYTGRIFCTPGTLDLCRVVLPDAGRLQEEDARQANKHRYTRHNPAVPLFTEADAFRAIAQLQPVGYDRPIEVLPGVEVDFIPAGHLLGSAYARVRVGGRQGTTVLFGGDLGRYGRPVLPDPSPVAHADVLLVESTYGNRVHPEDDDGEALAQVIRATLERKGRVIIPSFAIGRVEEVLYWIKRLEEAKRIPVTPVFVDSPMAKEALRFYSQRLNELDSDLGPHRRDVSVFATSRFKVVQTVDESKALTASNVPGIIISSSGMATGGRVLHHLARALPDPRSTVLFVGYQAEATRGRDLVDGAREVRIHGQVVPVAATIARLDAMSAHADQQEILRWLGGFEQPPKQTFLVHGEPDAMDTLKGAIERTLQWNVAAPNMGERREIG
jgi:metallo-beta-lactamase family protein